MANRMDLREIKETPIWRLYEKGRNYHRMTGIYADSDRNYRMYNGNQWEGVNLGGVEPIQENFIKSIVKYKVGVIHDNLYAIVYSSQNYENKAFRKAAEQYCKLLNNYASKVWELGKLDFLGRRLTKDAAINDEGIMYVDFDKEKKIPINQIIKKNDIYYGNENDDDIQSQPYILIRKRMPVLNALAFAQEHGLPKKKLDMIVGDNDNFEESGDAAKQEVNSMVTIVYKLWKENKTVRYSIATRWVDIAEDIDTGLKIYPIAHFNWEEKEGSARGEGEVRYLIPTQIEVNKMQMRRVLTAKTQAFPHKVVDVSKISNPNQLNAVGGVLHTKGATVEDVHKIVGTIPASQMSPDVKLLYEDLMQKARDLAGAGDTATGQVDPESASGRAILAVQQASQAPMTEQKESYKNFVEDLAKIWLEYLIVHAVDGVNIEDTVTDPNTGEETVQIVNVPQVALEQLQATVKIDITPRTPFDRFAQEQTIENLLMNGLLHPQRLGELKIYYKILPDDAVAPKEMIGKAIDFMEEEQRKIAIMNARAQQMQQQVNQFLMGDPEEQSSMMADAHMEQMLMAQGMTMEKGIPEEETE